MAEFVSSKWEGHYTSGDVRAVGELINLLTSKVNTLRDRGVPLNLIWSEVRKWVPAAPKADHEAKLTAARIAWNEARADYNEEIRLLSSEVGEGWHGVDYAALRD